MFRQPDLKRPRDAFQKVKGFVDKLFQKKPKVVTGEFSPKERWLKDQISSTHNHGVGKSKAVKKMADRSRRINRGGRKDKA